MIINLDRIPFYDGGSKITYVDISDSESASFGPAHELGLSSMYAFENNNTYYSINHDLYVIYTAYEHMNFNLTSVIPPNILQKIYNKEVILTFDYSTEATLGIVDIIYDKFIIEQKIPASQVLLVANTPNLKDYILNKAKSLNLDPIKYECYYHFMKLVQKSFSQELVINETLTPPIKNPLVKNSFSKKFIFMNRTIRHARVMLLLMLYERQLLPLGYVSFIKPILNQWSSFVNGLTNKFPNFDFYFKSLRPTVRLPKPSSIPNDVYEILPLKVDNANVNDTINIMRYNTGLHKFYSDSYFSVVCDTFYDNTDPFHPTEKMFRTILYKHPFIVVSTPGYLQNLRDLGFKTFDGIIDEYYYDNEKDDAWRLLRVAEEIERLCNLTPEQLDDFREKALPIVEHNFKVLMETKQFTNKIL
jgi:hypothetical protein